MQPAFDRQSRSDDKDIFGKTLVLGISYFVQHLPRDDHRHDDGFTGSGGHLGAEPGEFSSVTRDFYALPLGRRSLHQPDEGFIGFQLTEEEPPPFTLLWVVPVIEQALRDAGDAGVTRFSPQRDAPSDLIDQGQRDKFTGVIKRFGVFRGTAVSAGRRPSLR